MGTGRADPIDEGTLARDIVGCRAAAAADNGDACLDHGLHG